MNKDIAMGFLQRLFSELWTTPELDKVTEFYHSDVVGYIGGQTIELADIKNRIEFCQKKYSYTTTHILDVIAEDEKIAARLKQTCVSLDGKIVFEHHPFVIYEMQQGKISKLWFLTDRSFDYAEKA